MADATLGILLQANDAASQSIDKVSGKLGALGNAAGAAGQAIAIGLAVGVTAIVGLGAAAFKIGSDFDEAFDKIRIGTGKTGEALGGLQADFKSVFARTPASMDDVSTAITELSKRTRLAGIPLQNLAQDVLELSRLTDTDLNANIAASTRLFGDWSIASGDESKTLDRVFRASQATGIGVSDLMQKVVQFGAPLRSMGFGLTDSIAMLGKWEKEGVNSELVLGSLRIAMGEFANANIPMRKGLMDTIKTIQQLGPSAKATALAMDVFGARAGPDMAAAILEGRFAYEDLLGAIEGGQDTILGAAKDTEDFGEKFTRMKNRLLVAVEPIGSAMLGLASSVMDKLTPALEDLTNWITATGIPKLKDLWGEVEKLANKFAPLKEAIQRALGGDTSSLVAAFGATLAGLFGKDMAKAGMDVADALSKIVKWLGDKALPDAQKILGDITKWLGDNAWSSAAGFAKDIATWLGMAAWPGVVGFAKDIAIWLGKAAWPAVASHAKEIVTWLGKDAWPAVAGFAKDIATWLGDKAWPNVVGWAAAIVTWLKDTAGFTVGGGLKAIVGWLQNDAWGTVSGWLDAIGTTLTGTVVPQTQAWAAQLQTAVPLLEQMAGAMIKIATVDLPPRLVELANNIGTLLMPVVMACWGEFEKFYAGLQERLGPAIDNVGLMISGFIGIIQSLITMLVGVQGAADETGNRWNILAKILGGVWSIIQGIVEVGWAIVKGVIYVGLDLLAGRWDKAWEDMKGIFKGVWDGIEKVLRGAVDIYTGIITGWLETMKGLLGGLWNAGWKAGRDLVYGLWAGIESLGGWLAGLVGGFVTEHIPDPIKNALGMHSPSEVMEEIGGDIILGLVEGMKNEIREVERAIINLEKTITGLGGISLGGGAISVQVSAKLEAVMGGLANEIRKIERAVLQAKDSLANEIREVERAIIATGKEIIASLKIPAPVVINWPSPTPSSSGGGGGGASFVGGRGGGPVAVNIYATVRSEGDIQTLAYRVAQVIERRSRLA